MVREAVRFGYQCPLYPWDTILELCEFCEKAGFDAVTMADHTVSMGMKRIEALEAWTVLANLAARTQRVLLGTVVSDVHRRHPAVLAQTVATVDHLSRGRVFLGLGAGEAMNLDPYGIRWSKPVSRTLEALEVMRTLWTHAEGRVNFHGEFYNLTEAPVMTPHQKPRPPVWIAANSLRMLEHVGKLGDGWIPAVPMTPEMYREGLTAVRDMAHRHGRNPDAVTPGLFTYFVVAENYDSAKSLIELPAKMFAVMAPATLRKMGFEVPEGYSLLTFKYSDPTAVEKLRKDAERLPFDVVERSGFIFGTPDDCIGRIEDYIHAGVRFFIMPAMVSLKLMKPTVQLFAEKILPY
ncbi:MAG: LLM class flavin-dependent oxidoreductase, partial [Candidatus Bathyarchaeia archaeon]